MSGVSLLVIIAILMQSSNAYCSVPVPDFSSIASSIKPKLWKRMLEDKEVIVNAKLEELPEKPSKKYSFYAGMLVGASLAQSRKVLMDYKLYANMIPYIDKAEYSLEDKNLKLEGGIWKFKLRSQVEFTEKSDRWIHYKIVGGHFLGLTGDIYFEPRPEKGTLVYFQGEQTASFWPPKFVIERGAEIVFEFTAKRMRSYIESQKKMDKGIKANEQRRQEIPQPHSHL